MELKKKVYRLRKKNRVVGIMVKHKERFAFKGKEFLWWILGMPKYNFVDEGIGLTDIKGNDIFELDIVEINDSVSEEVRMGIILWNGECFGLFMIEEKEFFPLEIEGLKLFTQKELEVVSYLFEQEELCEDLGLQHLLR